MKICISAVSNNLDALLDPRFGRCAFLLFIDDETMHFEAMPNISASATGGAGIQTAQTVANKGAKVVITGNVGPNAFQALTAAGIEIMSSECAPIKEVIKKFKKGELKNANSPTVGEHSGMRKELK